MACLITKSRGLACKDQRTGIKWIDLVPYDAANAFTVSAQEIATLPAGITEVFRYQVKGTGNTFVNTGTSNTETRTTDFKEVLNVLLQRTSKDSEVELKALLFGAVTAFVHDWNGNVKVAGIEAGLDATTAEYSSETSGYKITLEGTSSTFAPLLSSSAKTALEALVSETMITL